MEQGDLIDCTKKNLVDLRRTCLVAGYNALVTFNELYPAVLALFVHC